MAAHTHNAAISYVFATAVLSLYGVEVCPFIEELGYGGIVPVFALAFGVRSALVRRLGSAPQAASPAQVLVAELIPWFVAAVALTVFDAIVYGFPVGSGLKVMIGVVAFALPAATHQALLAEWHEIDSVCTNQQRRAPRGRAVSLSSRLYRFVAATQVLLAVVLVMLVAKDFKHVVVELQAGRTPAYWKVAIEIGGAFVLLMFGTFVVTRQYGRNLDRLLRSHLEALAAVADGKLDRVVPVVANDELGNIGDRTNGMIDELRDKERIKGVFGKLVSPAVAEAILADDGGAELGGREVEAVVLFTDLRNFTALSEKTSPQGVVGFLNEYFTMIVDAVYERQGVVDKFIGDAAMAVFGLEGADNDDERRSVADRAVLSALAMREGLGPVNLRLSERGLPQVDNGIGLHFGPMVAGNIGSKDRLEYTVIGDAVNTASRLESLCKEVGSPLLISSSLYDRLSPEVAARLSPLGAHSVKGKAQPIEVFGLAGA